MFDQTETRGTEEAIEMSDGDHRQNAATDEKTFG